MDERLEENDGQLMAGSPTQRCLCSIVHKRGWQMIIMKMNFGSKTLKLGLMTKKAENMRISAQK